jgi:phage baseplate assembly protein gpV
MMTRPGTAYRKIPFQQLAPGLLVTPGVGEQVVVLKFDDGSHFAMFPQGFKQDVTMPVLGENELCFKFDDDSEIRVQNTGSGYEVELSGSAAVTINSGGDASVTAAGDVDVDAGGDVSVDGRNVSVSASNVVDLSATRISLGNGGKAVARVGDSVRIFDPLTGTRTGQITSGSSSVSSQ